MKFLKIFFFLLSLLIISVSENRAMDYYVDFDAFPKPLRQSIAADWKTNAGLLNYIKGDPKNPIPIYYNLIPESDNLFYFEARKRGNENQDYPYSQEFSILQEGQSPLVFNWFSKQSFENIEQDIQKQYGVPSNELFRFQINYEKFLNNDLGYLIHQKATSGKFRIRPTVSMSKLKNEEDYQTVLSNIQDPNNPIDYSPDETDLGYQIDFKRTLAKYFSPPTYVEDTGSLYNTYRFGSAFDPQNTPKEIISSKNKTDILGIFVASYDYDFGNKFPVGSLETFPINEPFLNAINGYLGNQYSVVKQVRSLGIGNKIMEFKLDLAKKYYETPYTYNELSVTTKEVTVSDHKKIARYKNLNPGHTEDSFTLTETTYEGPTPITKVFKGFNGFIKLENYGSIIGSVKGHSTVGNFCPEQRYAQDTHYIMYHIPNIPLNNDPSSPYVPSSPYQQLVMKGDIQDTQDMQHHDRVIQKLNKEGELDYFLSRYLKDANFNKESYIKFLLQLNQKFTDYAKTPFKEREEFYKSKILDFLRSYNLI